MQEANMDDARAYLGKLFDRYHNRNLRERAWHLQDKMDEDSPIKSADKKFVDFYWDFFIDCSAFTPDDFTALMLFANDPEKHVLYIDKRFVLDSALIDYIKSILPTNATININRTESIDLDALKEDECYITTIGNSYTSHVETVMTLEAFLMHKTHPTKIVDR